MWRRCEMSLLSRLRFGIDNAASTLSAVAVVVTYYCVSDDYADGRDLDGIYNQYTSHSGG